MTIHGNWTNLSKLTRPDDRFMGCEAVMYEDLNQELTPVDCSQFGQVTVHKFAADFDDLELQTISLLVRVIPPPVLEHEIRSFFGRVIRLITREQPDLYMPNIYANPMFRVVSDTLDRDFLIQARQCQREWKRYLIDSIGTPYLVTENRMTRRVLKQLVVDGIMIAERKHRFPGKWPEPVNQHCKIGQTFGRLTIESVLAGQKCRCKCECGKVSVVRSTHLRSGKTRSCGCLRDESQARAKLGKHRRKERYN